MVHGFGVLVLWLGCYLTASCPPPILDLVALSGYIFPRSFSLLHHTSHHITSHHITSHHTSRLYVGHCLTRSCFFFGRSIIVNILLFLLFGQGVYWISLLYTTLAFALFFVRIRSPSLHSLSFFLLLSDRQERRRSDLDETDPKANSFLSFILFHSLSFSARRQNRSNRWSTWCRNAKRLLFTF